MAELGGRRQRRNWQLIGAVCALLIIASAVYALRQILHGGLEPSDTAGVLGLPLGATGLAAAVTALRKPMEGNDSDLARARTATLAKQVEAGEDAVWRQLLGDDVRRINLTYALQPAAARPAVALPAGRLTADAAGPVSVPDIVTYYRATRPLRLGRFVWISGRTKGRCLRCGVRPGRWLRSSRSGWRCRATASAG